MKATIFIVLIAVIFTIAPCQSRMRPVKSDSIQQLHQQFNNSIGFSAESLVSQDYEDHNNNLIYRRSRFADVEPSNDDKTMNANEEGQNSANVQQYANFLGRRNPN